MTMLETAITRSSTAVLITLLHTHQYIYIYIYIYIIEARAIHILN